MRKLWALLFSSILTLALLVLGSAPAQAFGSEVLGCGVGYDSVSSSWTANSCGTGASAADYYFISYSPHNLSGAYSYQWTLTSIYKNGSGTLTSKCTTTPMGACIYSGCTVTSSTCIIKVVNPPSDRTYIASLRLTQSGQSRTIQAQALITGDPGTCLSVCP